MTKMNLCFLCVFNLLQDIHQFALRQIDVYLSQARAQKNTHHYLLITPYILITTVLRNEQDHHMLHENSLLGARLR